MADKKKGVLWIEIHSYLFSVQFVKDFNGGLMARSKVVVIETNSECSLCRRPVDMMAYI